MRSRFAQRLRRAHPHPAATRQQAAKSPHPSPIKGGRRVRPDDVYWRLILTLRTISVTCPAVRSHHRAARRAGAEATSACASHSSPFAARPQGLGAAGRPSARSRRLEAFPVRTRGLLKGSAEKAPVRVVPFAAPHRPDIGSTPRVRGRSPQPAMRIEPDSRARGFVGHSLQPTRKGYPSGHGWHPSRPPRPPTALPSGVTPHSPAGDGLCPEPALPLDG